MDTVTAVFQMDFKLDNQVWDYKCFFVLFFCKTSLV